MVKGTNMTATLEELGKAAITDCGPDGGCEECDVCRYLNFLEWAGAVGKPEGSTIERDERMERYLKEHYPWI